MLCHILSAVYIVRFNEVDIFGIQEMYGKPRGFQK